MARKPAKTEADAAAQTMVDNVVADAADAPSTTPAADEPGQTGGEVGADLPAGITASQLDAIAETAATPMPIIPKGADLEFIGMDLAVPEFAWIVTCHREGGRRRAGRRWPQGETPVTADELTGYELAMLKGDPLFTVRTAAAA